jgi:hypothetical protein
MDISQVSVILFLKIYFVLEDCILLYSQLVEQKSCYSALLINARTQSRLDLKILKFECLIQEYFKIVAKTTGAARRNSQQPQALMCSFLESNPPQ